MGFFTEKKKDKEETSQCKSPWVVVRSLVDRDWHLVGVFGGETLPRRLILYCDFDKQSLTLFTTALKNLVECST